MYKITFISLKTQHYYKKEFSSIAHIVNYIFKHAGQRIYNSNLTLKEQGILQKKFRSLCDVIVEEV